MAKRIDSTPYDYINRLSTKDTKTGCWNWCHLQKGRATGAYYYWPKFYKVNRPYQVSYIIYKGDYDRKLSISHICNNPACVNPEHLVAETHKENLSRMHTNKKNKCYIEPHHFDDVLNLQELTPMQIKNRLGIPICKIKRILKKSAATVTKGIKITDSQIEEIKALRAEGNKLAYIANLFNVTESMICRICKGNRRNIL